MSRINSLISGMLLLLIGIGSGCQLLNGAKLASLPEASVVHPVVEIICVWQPGEGTGMDGLPCRGFAGQILFFSMGEKTPVRVNGNVRVYVFDDQGTEAEQELPIHQFDFDGSSFQNFLTTTNMGAAYQLFIPYTRKGSHSATCTLRVRYSPEEGSSVYSKMASLNLPGTTARKPDEPIGATASKQERDAKVISNLLQPVSHEEQKSNDQISLASATDQMAVPNENKQRLRDTLTQISQINPETTPNPAADASAQAALQAPARSFKLHPLADAPPVAVPEENHPLKESVSQEPAVEKGDPEKKPAPQSDTPSTDTNPPSPAQHPLLDD